MDRPTMWWMAYCTIVGMKCHPRNEVPPDLEACATLADVMMAEFVSRWTGVSREVSYGDHG